MAGSARARGVVALTLVATSLGVPFGVDLRAAASAVEGTNRHTAARSVLQPSATNQSPPGPTSRRPTDYVVGPQDVLTVVMFADPTLSGRYGIESDGHFTFPLVGKVRAAGLTAAAVETALKAKLAEGFFKDPQLTVAVESFRSQRIFVVGQVTRPNAYPLSGEMTLLEALSLAGPVTSTAGDELIIVRPRQGADIEGPLLPDQPEVSTTTRVDLRDLQNGVLFQGVKLRDGDTIFVPKAENIFIFGQVRSPGSYPLQRGMTILQALSLAGGVTDRGSTGRIFAARTVDGKKKDIKVKLTDLVLPGDTIIVRERFF